MIDSNSIAQRYNVHDVVPKYLSVSGNGDRLTALCPFHDDKKMSLFLYKRKNRAKCFACGWSGNSISFIMDYLNKNFREAVEILEHGGQFVAAPITKNKVQKEEEWVMCGVDTEPSVDMFKHYKYGWPDVTYRYEYDGGFGYICRFETSDGKQVVPLTFRTNGQYSKWMWKGFDAPRPLYRIRQALQHDKVILVEGEKCVDAISDIAASLGYGVTTWVGGANAAHLTDFSPLQDKHITYWPDNDAQGLSAMVCAATKIQGSSSVVLRYIPLNYTLPKGYDCADGNLNIRTLKTILDSGCRVDVFNTLELICVSQVGSGTEYVFGIKNNRWCFAKKDSTFAM